MLKDIGQIYQEVGAACAAVTQGPIRLSDEFIASYTQFIVAQQQVKGGFKSVSFDANGATLQKGGGGVSITTVTNYSFVIAHVLCPLLKVLKEYKSIFDQIYADKTAKKRVEISEALRNGDAVAVADLDVRISGLTQDEQSKMKRFLTDYDWWHGGKAVGRTNDYFNSPLLSCAKLVAANNGAIPTIVTHFCEEPTLFNSFAYSDALAGGGNEKSLDVALRMFTINRVKTEWCADNTDGDTVKSQTGYVANAKLRAAMPMTNNLGTDAQVVQWFKDYVYPNGKSWLDGIDTSGCAAFGGYINYLVTGGAAVARPAKFTRSLESAVKAIVKPASECFYNKDIHAVLKYLGLVGFEFKEDFDEDDYQDALHAQRVIKRRLKDMGEKQIVEWDAAANQAKPNGKEPDFLAVNEFLWFVKTHLNEIENKIVEKKMEPAKHKELSDSEKNKKPVVNMADSDDVLLLRLRAALRTKPFAILAGHSGTGKSRMVRKLAYMTCNDEALRKDANGVEFKEPGNFCMIQVKPNWHDSCDLLGYYSELGKRYRASEFVKFICKAYAYPKTPFFVCLDEMNLAPVEQYFAEYLSAIESRKLQNVEILEGNPLAAKKVVGVTTDELVPKTAYVIKDETGEAFHADWVGCETPEAEYWLKKYGLTIPRNLFVVGTVNMDESTNQFSRKVLDRAMTIEMTDADFDAFGKQPPELNFANVPYMGDAAVADLLAGKVQATELLDDQKKNLNALKAVLASTSFAVAYRFANEYALYEDALKSTAAKSYKPASVEGADPTDQIDLSALTSEAEAGSAASADGGDGSGATAEGSAAVSASAKKPAIPSAFDDMVLMKVLPRISGDEADVKRIFYEGPAPEKLSPRPSETAPAENTLLKLLGPKKDTASVRKIKWILARGGSYLSFWP